MSIHQGSFSLSRYRVTGRKTNLSLSDLNQNLPRLKLKPFRLNHSRKELTYGWDAPWGELESKGKHWDMSDCQIDGGFWLRIRVEKRAVPTQLLQLVVSEKEQKILENTDLERLNRKKRKELLEEARDELLKQTLPTVRYFEAYWKEQEDVIFLFSTSKANRAIFEELFRKTFGSPNDLGLVLMTPPLLGMGKEFWSEEKLSQVDEDFLSQIESTLPTGIQMGQI